MGPPLAKITTTLAHETALGSRRALISGMIIIMALGALQMLGLLLPSPREAEVGAPPRTAATSTEDVGVQPCSDAGSSQPEEPRTFIVLSLRPPQAGVSVDIHGCDNCHTGAGAQLIADWTLEQLLEAQMTPERWDDATGRDRRLRPPHLFGRKLPPDSRPRSHRAQ